ncbi:hypothetical protein [Deinococcus multiflagellatus]|uniref:hypothetical protein n=1 Tax=Deinococcus multiflagellatus TaxID=1656887 RepID=UPI001CCE3129|nr:hypothetical protein [Deinococcus multiflagellatus]MBZ9715622.1 hypothetical protein [Deinococcus multiflagellatus]
MARPAGAGAALGPLPLSAVQQVQLCGGLTLVALGLSAVPALREASVFLVPVVAAQILVRHAFGVTDRRLHRLGTVHLALCAVVIGVTGQVSGLPGAWGVALGSLMLLLALDGGLWRWRRRHAAPPAPQT